MIEAERHFREALNIDDRNVQAYAALQDIYVGNEQWHELIDLLERRFQATVGDDPDAAVDMLQTIATLQEDQLDDSYSAVDTHQRVLELEPDEANRPQALRRLFREQERWDDLADLLRDSRFRSAPIPIARSSSNQSSVTCFEESLSRPFDALDIYREILSIEPGHEATVESLEPCSRRRPSEARYRRSARADLPFRRELVGTRRCFRAWPSPSRVGRRCLISRRPRESPKGVGRSAALVRYLQATRASASRGTTRRGLSMRRLAGREKGDWHEVVDTYDEVLTESFEVDDRLALEFSSRKGRGLRRTARPDLDEAATPIARRCLRRRLREAVDSLDRASDSRRRRGWIWPTSTVIEPTWSTDPEDTKEWLEKAGDALRGGPRPSR